MSEPVVKIGKYAGTGAYQSIALGFIPDTIIIEDVTNKATVFIAHPNLTNFSSGTATRLNSAIMQVGAAGTNYDTSTNIGSYVMPMGGTIDSTKRKGIFVGVKLSVSATNYIYTAFRSGAGEQGGL